MVASTQVAPGMVITVDNKVFQVESAVKVSVPKRAPFMKVKLKDVNTSKTIEKNFKLTQQLKEVQQNQKQLEFLYLEGKNYLFLDQENLDLVKVPSVVVGNKVDYLKEGTPLTAYYHSDTVFSVELPQFLEVMVSVTEGEDESDALSNVPKIAVLETGARIEVPAFIQAGDIIRVDTLAQAFVQRV